MKRLRDLFDNILLVLSKAWYVNRSSYRKNTPAKLAGFYPGWDFIQ